MRSNVNKPQGYVASSPEYEEQLNQLEALLKAFRERLRGDGIQLVIETEDDGTFNVYGVGYPLVNRY